MPRHAFRIVSVCCSLAAGAALGAGDPYVNLADARELKPAYVAATSAAAPGGQEGIAPLALGAARPLSLATDDFDLDGFPDLVAGYGYGEGGFLAVHHGNPEAFGPTDPAVLRGIGVGRFPDPFVERTEVVAVPEAPELLAAGDFDRDGTRDLVFAARRGGALYFLAGDGRGGFAAPRSLEVAGRVTALATERDFDGRSLLVAALAEPPAVLFYGGADGIASEHPISVPLPAEPEAVALGILDDEPGLDAALLAGGGLFIVHGRSAPAADPRFDVEKVDVPFTVKAFALGNFVWDRDGRTEIAALAPDGEVRVLSRGNLDTRPFTESEIRDMRQRLAAARDGAREPLAGVVPQPAPRLAWRLAGRLASSVSANGSSPRLFATRLSSLPSDDLVLVEPAEGRLRVVHESPSRDASRDAGAAPRREVPVGTPSDPVAVLPMRLSVDGRPGLVVLGAGRVAPYAVVPLAAVTYHVTGMGDSTAACSAPSGGVSSCPTLRSAILASNANAGADTIVFDFNGTVTLSISSGTGHEDAAATGDLDINDSLTITGNGSANTVISTNYTATCGDCKVFGVDQPGAFPSLTVAFSGLTVQNGYNNGAAYCGTFYETGGGIDFYLVSTGNAFSMTNCVVTNNKAVSCAASHGGGVNVDSTVTASVGGPSGGTVTFTNCTFSSNMSAAEGGGLNLAADKHDVNLTNDTVTGNQTTLSTAAGGGIDVEHSFGGTVTMSGGSIQNNTAGGAGGGLNLTFNPNASISNVTISGNTSNSSGGGSSLGGGVLINPIGVAMFTPTIALSGCTISGNHADTGAAAAGGGVAFNSFYSASLTNCTLSNNTSKSGAGVFNGGSSATPPAVLTVSGGSITGNTATGDGGGLMNLSTASVTSLTNNVAIGGAGALKNTALNGGGIGLAAGTFTLASGNATLGANTATGSGGQVYLSGGTMNLNSVTLSAGTAVNGGAAASSGGTLNLTSNAITGNTATGSGGGIYNNGGAMTLSGVTIGGAAALANTAANGGGFANALGTVTLSTGNVTFGANSATGAGGLIRVSGGSLTLNGLTLTGGTAPNGGAASVSGGTLTLSKNTIIANTASSSGGALHQSGGTLNGTYNRIVNNTAAGVKSGLTKTAGTTTVNDNWWGCSTTPTALPCDVVSGFAPASWLQLRVTDSPDPIYTPSGPSPHATTLTASFLTNSAGTPVALSNLTTLIGLPIAWGNAMLGTLSGSQTSIQASGTATSTFTAGAVGGIGHADATVDNGTTTGNINVYQPTSVTSQPSPTTVCAGTMASFTAAADGYPVPSVQWQQSTDGGMTFQNVAGATMTTYSFTTTAPQNNNQYRAVFTNVVNSATSNAVALTVNTAPSIGTPPSPSTICAGNGTMFSVAATGTALTYQWQVDPGSGFVNLMDGAPYSNVTTATMTITGATAGMNGYLYRCVVSGTCPPMANSSAALLTVNTAPSVSAQPSDSTCALPATFTVGATGTALTYQWQENTGAGFVNVVNGGTNPTYSGATTATLTITNPVAGMQGYAYQCVVSGTCPPPATSNAATLNVDTAVPVVTAPGAATVTQTLCQ